MVDHAWTFEAEHAKDQLKISPGLLARMADLVGCAEKEDTSGKDLAIISLKIPSPA